MKFLSTTLHRFAQGIIYICNFIQASDKNLTPTYSPMETDQHLDKALQAAQMYYFQNLPMKRIASELQVSHSTISRLLTWARNEGLIEIRINDARRRSSPLEELIKLHFKLKAVKVVPVAEVAGENVWRDRVARVAANYLNQFMGPNIILGVSVSHMVNQISACLTPKSLLNVQVVQLNGGEYVPGLAHEHAGNLIAHIANNYEAIGHLFSVPSFFDFLETREVLWKESSIKRILELQNRSNIILFSPESIHENDRLKGLNHINEEADLAGLIANIFIRADGSHENIVLNKQACGPDLQLFQEADRVICAVSGLKNLECIKGTLRGRYLTDLIIDEPTARRLTESISDIKSNTK
ncbi:MAG: sugar-binding domain-containing protein [Chloroflexota bacterium]